MKQKPEPEKSKEEKERRALYDAIRGRLGEMRHCLKTSYMDYKINRVDEAIIHGLNVGLHDIENIFFDVLIDTDASVKEIMKLRAKELGARILPVR